MTRIDIFSGFLGAGKTTLIKIIMGITCLYLLQKKTKTKMKMFLIEVRVFICFPKIIQMMKMNQKIIIPVPMKQLLKLSVIIIIIYIIFISQ